MLFQAYLLGFRRKWREIFGWVLGSWGLVWLFVESVSFFSSGFKAYSEHHGELAVEAALVLALIYVLWRLPEPTQISFCLKTTNTRITIRFGDLFKSRGHIAIPVNEFFDGELGRAVSDQSVHGQFIQRGVRRER